MQIDNDLPLGLFPALAGMNRAGCSIIASSHPVPRARGDEPAGLNLEVDGWFCSPRSRG